MSTTTDLWPVIEPRLSKVKATGGEVYRCHSPLRPDSDSLSFSLKRNPSRPGGGTYFDHVTEESGSFYSLAIALGLIEDPGYARTSGLPVLDAFSTLDDYEQRQIGEQCGAYAHARWRVDDRYCSTHKKQRPALVFPTRTGERWRFTDGLKPKYGQPKGYTGCWYGMPGARQVLVDHPERSLVLCNGEASVVAAQHWGLPAICVTGGGERGIPEPLLADLFTLIEHTGNPVLFIAMDCDNKGRQASAKLVAQIYQANLEYALDLTVRAVDLQGDKGFDLANFTKLHQHDAAIALLSLPDAPEPEQTETPAQLKARLAQVEAELEQWKTVVRRQQEMLQEKESELQAVKDINRWQSEIHRATENVQSAGKRDTIIALRKVLDHDKEEAAKHDGWVHTSLGRLAEDAGVSKPTASRHLSDFEKSKLIEIKNERTFDEEMNQFVTVKYVRAIVDLSDPEQVVVKSAHGGKREPKRCPDCGSVHIATKHQDICMHCGTAQNEATYTLVNDPELVNAEIEAGGPEIFAASDDLAVQDEQRIVAEAAPTEAAPAPRPVPAKQQSYIKVNSP